MRRCQRNCFHTSSFPTSLNKTIQEMQTFQLLVKESNYHLSAGIHLNPFFFTRLLNCSMTWFDNDLNSRRTMFRFRLRAMLHWLETFVLFSIKLFIQWNIGYHRELIATRRWLFFNNWTSMLRLHDSPSKPHLTVHTPPIYFSFWHTH